MADLGDTPFAHRDAPAMTDAFPTAALPDLTVDQMREVDRIMIDVLQIGLVQMMENAGRSLADLAIRRHAPTSCVVLAGPGGNGGGGLVADATLTLALPKVARRGAPDVVGDLFAADISVPPVVYERLRVPVDAPFAAGPIVRVA